MPDKAWRVAQIAFKGIVVNKWYILPMAYYNTVYMHVVMAYIRHGMYHLTLLKGYSLGFRVYWLGKVDNKLRIFCMLCNNLQELRMACIHNWGLQQSQIPYHMPFQEDNDNKKRNPYIWDLSSRSSLHSRIKLGSLWTQGHLFLHAINTFTSSHG